MTEAGRGITALSRGGGLKALGKVGQGLSFDGVDDKVTLSSALSIGTAHSFSAWIDFQDAVDGVVFGRHPSSPSPGYLLYIDQTNLYYNAGAGNFVTVPHGGMVPGQWSFITVIRNGTSVTFYKNGSQIGSTQTLSFDDVLTGVTTIGSYEDGTYPTKIKLDEVRVYNRALSASEVTQLYQAGTANVNTAQNTKLTTGLVGLWSLNGADVTDKVYDRSGQGNNGYFIGGATSSAKTIGKVGQALGLNGTSGYVGVPDSNSLTPSTANLTVSSWVNLTTIPASGAPGIVSKRISAGVGDEYNLFYWIGGTNGTGFYARINGDQTGGTYAYYTITPPIGTWIHITTVYNGASIKLYYNGQPAGTNGTKTGTITNSTGLLNIGALQPGSGFFNGKIDEVRIYNRALSAAEVGQLYNLGR
jgi:hypothetical protein